MKDKKNEQKKPNLMDGMELSGFAASATDFTGLVPTLGEDDLEFANYMYSELYGIPVTGTDIAGEETSQYKIPQV